MSKKIIIILAIIAVVAAVAGIGWTILNKSSDEGGKQASEKMVEGTLEEIMTKIYSGIPEENLPMLGNIEVTSEDVEYYLGTADIDYSAALASEPMMSSIAHSVVLVRLTDAKTAEDAVQKIKTNADPRKWICVEASNVIVKSKGDLVILIMVDTEMTSEDEAIAPKLEANFDNL